MFDVYALFMNSCYADASGSPEANELAKTLQVEESTPRSIFDLVRKCLVVVIHDTRAVLVRLWNAVTLTQILLLTLALRVKVRSLRLVAHSHGMSPVRSESICRAVIRDAIVPERNIACLPLEASMKFWRSGDNLIKQSDDVIRLRLGDADDFGDEARVEEDTLPT
jgi:hypothetical protein